MSYGLYDGDLHLYPQVPFFNLELMKYSTYYKRKREIAVFTPTFKPSMYTHYLIRQDYPSRQPYSAQYKNLIFGGRAFDGTTYKPLPLDIELSKPDTLLYNKIEKEAVNSRDSKTSFNTMRRAEHVRLSLDGITIHSQWDKQLRRNQDSFGLILHDYDISAIEGVYQFLKDNLSQISPHKNGARIGMKFPVQTYTEKELLDWLQFPPLNQYYFVQYNGILTLNHIQELIDNRAESTAQKQIIINPIYGMDYTEFTTTGIIQLFQSILDLRRYRLIFPLIYDKTFFINNRWVEVLKLFDIFINHINFNINRGDYFQRVVPFETFYSYVKKEATKDYDLHTCITKKQAQEVFQFVREHNYELFKLFYEYTGEMK